MAAVPAPGRTKKITGLAAVRYSAAASVPSAKLVEVGIPGLNVFALARTRPAENLTWLGALLSLRNGNVGGSALPAAGCRVDWYCGDLRNQEQAEAWCVPACMSILSPRICGKFVSASTLATEWRQGQGQTFDCDTMYMALRRFCLRHRMCVGVDYDGTPQRKDWSWFTSLKRPTLIVFDRHAKVCIGTGSIALNRDREIRGYCVLNPGTMDASWTRFPDCGSIGLDFGFVAPGSICADGRVANTVHKGKALSIRMWPPFKLDRA
jgi:hypothetical protein